MGASRLQVEIVSCLVATLAYVCGSSAKAEPAPRKPTVIAGSGKTYGGVFSATSEGAVIELPSRTKLTVAPNASLRIFGLPQLLALTPGPRTWTWSFALQSGRVDVELPSTGRNAVLATLGKLTAVTTSGHAVLRIQDQEAVAANVDGELRTQLASHWQTVPAGYISTLSRDDPAAVAKPGVPAPLLLGGQRMWFSPNGSVAMHGFHWAPVANAGQYELRLRRLSDGKLIDQRRTPAHELPDALTPVEPGKYGLTLRSIDAHGMEGAWTPEAEVRVIGVLLPPGGYTSERAIFLTRGQQVRFTHIDGLEMTYMSAGAGGGHYFPATEGASLHRGESTLLGFRMPGALETAVARLEPRAVYADIRISPARAVWPRDPISIDIRMKSRDGVEIPPFLQVKPQVTVGTELAKVQFERVGDVLHTVVPASDQPGPWVVRVDVIDQFGVELGHDFLEIAEQPPLRKAVTVASRTSAPAHVSSAKWASRTGSATRPSASGRD